MNKKFDPNKISRKEILNYLNQSSEVAEYQLTLIDEIAKVSEMCIETLNSGGKIIFCGNGGSASDSQHLAAELIGRFMKNRKPIPAISINTDTSVLTSLSNDFGYEHIFSKQISALGQSGDVLLAITTSGNSTNVIQAVEAAHNKNMTVIALSGRDGGKLAPHLQESDIEIRVEADKTSRIQEIHLLIIHCLCDIIDHKIFQTP